MKRIIPSLPACYDVDMKVDHARQMFLKAQGQMDGDSRGNPKRWKHFKPAKDGFSTGDFKFPQPMEKQSSHLDMLRGAKERCQTSGQIALF